MIPIQCWNYCSSPLSRSAFVSVLFSNWVSHIALFSHCISVRIDVTRHVDPEPGPNSVRGDDKTEPFEFTYTQNNMEQL